MLCFYVDEGELLPILLFKSCSQIGLSKMKKIKVLEVSELQCLGEVGKKVGNKRPVAWIEFNIDFLLTFLDIQVFRLVWLHFLF